jgi:hypothetical protein
MDQLVAVLGQHKDQLERGAKKLKCLTISLCASLDCVCRKSFLLFDRVVCGMLPNIGTEMSKKMN